MLNIQKNLGRQNLQWSELVIRFYLKNFYLPVLQLLCLIALPSHKSVEGVYTADPRIITNAQLIDEITYDEMLEMSSSGAGVLMARSVEFGRRYNVPIIVKSTFKNNKGTLVKEKVMEEAIVSGVTHNDPSTSVKISHLSAPKAAANATAVASDPPLPKVVISLVSLLNP